MTLLSKKNLATHEDYFRSEEVSATSDRSFGFVFAVVFLVLGLAPLRHHDVVRVWALGLAGIFLGTAFIFSRALRPLNKLWTHLAILIQKVMNPVIMGILFYCLFTPVALLLRLFGKDPMRRQFDIQATTYWIERSPRGPTPESLQSQF